MASQWCRTRLPTLPLSSAPRLRRAKASRVTIRPSALNTCVVGAATGDATVTVITAGRVASPPVAFFYDTPFITSMSSTASPYVTWDASYRTLKNFPLAGCVPSLSCTAVAPRSAPCLPCCSCCVPAAAASRSRAAMYAEFSPRRAGAVADLVPFCCCQLFYVKTVNVTITGVANTYVSSDGTNIILDIGPVGISCSPCSLAAEPAPLRIIIACVPPSDGDPDGDADPLRLQAVHLRHHRYARSLPSPAGFQPSELFSCELQLACAVSSLRDRCATRTAPDRSGPDSLACSRHG